MHRLFCCLLLILAVSLAPADDPPEVRAVYVPVFDTNTQARADSIINEVLSSNVNQVFVQVRARGDAYYYPNREDTTYPNPEPRAQLYSLTPSDLDLLQYYIDRLHSANPPREVHAWLTTYNTWNRSTPPASPAHIYNARPDLITRTKTGAVLTYENNAPLDPGIPEVQDYVFNVFMDIVRNYDIDGIHFDYIRLDQADSGYNPAAKAAFLEQTGWNFDTQGGGAFLDAAYRAWRRDQVAKLVQRIHAQTMLEKPWVETSAFIVSFTDSIANLAQGYNWWVAHGAIDSLHPSSYSSSVTTAVNRYNDKIARLAQSGDENSRRLVPALGSYLFEDANPDDNKNAVIALRTQARTPDGFNFFTHNSLFRSSLTPQDRMAQDLFNAGGPMDDWAPVPPLAHKVAELGQEFTPPNPPATLGATLVSGKPRVTFNRPAAAADGDLPVHYRLYRDTQNPPRLHYANMVMEWWDPDSSRTVFSFDDGQAPIGVPVHYAAAAYDDWNNRATSTTGPVTATAANEFIIETRSGGLNLAAYSEVAGSTFSDSTAHSTAPGTTAGIGSRFALPGDVNGRNDKARFSANSLATGDYQVFVTCFNFSSANAQGITVRFNDAGGVRTSTIDLTQANAGNTWYSVGTMGVTNGAGHYVEFDNSTQTNIGDSTNSRMNAAAVRFVAAGAQQTKEPKPAVAAPASATTEIIVDSEPTALDYDDDGGTGKWSTSTFGNYYNGSARFYGAANFPFNSVAMWVVDLPRPGKWAIDGWVRSNSSLADSVQYRFVDSTGTVRSTVATQHAPGDGWHIDVDGVSDENAHAFPAGRVYVTVYGNASGAQTLVADALRFRFVGDQTRMEAWQLF